MCPIVDDINNIFVEIKSHENGEQNVVNLLSSDSGDRTQMAHRKEYSAGIFSAISIGLFIDIDQLKMRPINWDKEIY